MRQLKVWNWREASTETAASSVFLLLELNTGFWKNLARFLAACIGLKCLLVSALSLYTKKLIPNHGDRKSTSAVVPGGLAMLLKCWLACHTAETPCKNHCGTQTRKCRREVLQSYHRYEWSGFISARCVHNHVQYRLKVVLF